MSNHETFMKLAIGEALKADPELTLPNPRVGAVIVEEGEVVASGYHEKYGEGHAEVNALKNLGRPPVTGSVMYVTLEPCSTTGKTGACCDAIKGTEIGTVVIGAIDPNPNHQGNAIEVLEAAGITVISGVLSDECFSMNPDFNQRMKELS